MIPIKRTNLHLKPYPRKVVLRYLDFGKPERFEPVVRYVLGLTEAEAEEQLKAIFAEFESRHFDLQSIFRANYLKLTLYVHGEHSLAKRLLMGAYFTHEYSIEAAALFNPSIVPHPDQDDLKEGELRFILSLRATGEGHISSIAFQTGVVNAAGEITLDPTATKLTCGHQRADVPFDKSFVMRQLEDGGVISDLVRDSLPNRFSEREALELLNRLQNEQDIELQPDREQIAKVFDLNYDLAYSEASPLNSRVIFPQSRSESNGMEDARFVAFTDKGETVYLGTYTAYNGKKIRPQLVKTKDFQYFRIRPFYGKAATDKGMALFPEKINGKYAMVGRQGGRCLSIMFSDDLYFWEDYQMLQEPVRDWEILQMGNCGSPVKTPYGWLLLTHAVGPMRKYVLSFSLLDLHNPAILLASLDHPLLSANEEEREGYVPNVLYTCGLILHGENLIIPYAMSDSAVSFAVVELKAVIEELQKGKIKQTT